MSPRSSGRTARCGGAEAEARLEHAKSFIEVAELVGGEDDQLATPNVAASLAVLAGIAASDAVCCASLGQRPRSQDHRQAIALLRQITEIGEPLARDLGRLLAVKDDAHYGVISISQQRLASTLRQARHLVDTAAEFLESS